MTCLGVMAALVSGRQLQRISQALERALDERTREARCS